jgi:hypothetical protein
MNEEIENQQDNAILEARKEKLKRFWWKFGQIVIIILLIIAIAGEYYIAYINKGCYFNPCYYADKLGGYVCNPISIPAGMS